MAKKKYWYPDRHKGGYMVRISDGYRITLGKMSKKLKVSIVEIVEQALDEHLAHFGVVVDKNSNGQP